MKKILLIVFISLFLFVICACDNNNNNNSTDDDILLPTELDTSKETVVTFYHKMAGYNYPVGVLEDIIESYEKDMSIKYGVKVTVELKSYSDYDDFKDEISNGTHATVIEADSKLISSFVKDNTISLLDKYIKHSEYGLDGSKEDSYGYIDSFFNSGSIYDKKGNFFSIPFNKNAEVLYYNKDLFDKYNWEIPTTWDEVIEICEAWKKTTEYQTLKDSGKQVGGLGIDEEENLFINLIKQWGSEYISFNENGDLEYRFDNQKTKAALTWLVDEFNNGNIVTSTYLDTWYCSDAFVDLQIPMAIGYSSSLAYYVSLDGSFITGVTTYPQMTRVNDVEKQVIQSGSNLSLFECVDKQEELFGWLFIKYLTSYESQLEWTTRTNFFPVRKDVIISEEFQDVLNNLLNSNSSCLLGDVYQVLISQLDYLYAVPTIDDSLSKGKFIINAILYNQKEYDIDKAIKDALNKIENS